MMLNILRFGALAVIPLLIISSASAAATSTVYNLSEYINSGGDDFSPTATESGRIVVFNSRRGKKVSHDLYMCKNSMGFWSSPIELKELNTNFNEETPFISPDGSFLLFASDRPGGIKPTETSKGTKLITYDIYISYNVKGIWSKPQLLKGDVNTTWNERSPSLSQDGRTLFFTRWPYKNFTKARLCSATLRNGRFTDVQEIASPIHDKSFEIAMIPSIEKNKYYFSSIRDGGDGGWDIYYTYFINDKFTKPVHLGEDINSEHDEMYYIQTKKYILMVSNRPGSLGGFDIYSNKLPAKGKKFIRKSYDAYKGDTRIKITSIDSRSGNIIKNRNFRIGLYSTEGLERTIRRTSNDKGYIIIRPKEDVLRIDVKPEGSDIKLSLVSVDVMPGKYQDIILKFTPENEKNIYEKENKEPAVIKKVTPAIDRKENGDSVNLDTGETHIIYFSFDSWKIKTDYFPLLHKIADKLRADRELRLSITGHAGLTGSVSANKKISLKRAKSVYEYMLGIGIKNEQLRFDAEGEKNPVIKSRGIKKNRPNRRVVLKIYR